MYCQQNECTPDDMSFEEQKAVFDECIDNLCYESEMFAAMADELDKQAYIKSLCETGLENIPRLR